jgi:hypothetical protein
MNIQNLFISVIFTLMVQSCTPRNQIGSNTCINKLIETKKTSAGVKEIWQYQLQEDLVYYIKMNGADQYNKLLNSKCEVICYPDGGITGHGDGKCPEFFEARAKGKILWP